LIKWENAYFPALKENEAERALERKSQGGKSEIQPIYHLIAGETPLGYAGIGGKT